MGAAGNKYCMAVTNQGHLSGIESTDSLVILVLVGAVQKYVYAVRGEGDRRSLAFHSKIKKTKQNKKHKKKGGGGQRPIKIPYSY